ncbi:hypothetical protein T484DRAFT_3584577 [Baffinella frigidus]|nr:hypothetical protein T484DRAFT_3584577 [Cryptophyta sp. CCMP2293]
MHPSMQAAHPSAEELSELPPLEHLLLHDRSSADCMRQVGAHLLYAAVEELPALVRLWFHDLHRATAIKVEHFTSAELCPLLLKKEIAKIQEAAVDHDEFSVRGSAKVRREREREGARGRERERDRVRAREREREREKACV